jgi:hypothetical protein
MKLSWQLYAVKSPPPDNQSREDGVTCNVQSIAAASIIRVDVDFLLVLIYIVALKFVVLSNRSKQPALRQE